MTTDQAQSAVTLSAFVVGAVFAYRKLSESTTGNAPNVGHFVIGYGFTYITLSLVAQGAPDLGGMLAILVAAGDLLANGTSLINDLSGALKRTAPTAASTATASATTLAPSAVVEQPEQTEVG